MLVHVDSDIMFGSNSCVKVRGIPGVHHGKLGGIADDVCRKQARGDGMELLAYRHGDVGEPLNVVVRVVELAVMPAGMLERVRRAWPQAAADPLSEQRSSIS